jgi:hypothetical protein
MTPSLAGRHRYHEVPVRGSVRSPSFQGQSVCSVLNKKAARDFEFAKGSRGHKLDRLYTVGRQGGQGFQEETWVSAKRKSRPEGRQPGRRINIQEKRTMQAIMCRHIKL